MKLTFLSGTWDLARKNNTVLLFSNIALSVALVVVGFLAFGQRERVVLIPPHIDKKMEISWSAANADYLKSWGLYVATLIGNITPKNINLVADALGAFLDPSIYPSVRAQVKSLADDPIFQRANAINYFAPEQVVYEIDTNKNQKVFVVGQLVTSSFEGPNAGKSGGEFKSVIYEMSVAMRDGRPVIIDFTSYPGTQPRTQKWLSSQSPEVQKAASERQVAVTAQEAQDDKESAQ